MYIKYVYKSVHIVYIRWSPTRSDPILCEECEYSYVLKLCIPDTTLNINVTRAIYEGVFGVLKSKSNSKIYFFSLFTYKKLLSNN